MKPIIEVESLTKEYSLNKVSPYGTLRDSLATLFKHPVASVSNGDKTFSALKNVTFNAYPGEVLGIIGHNGAGKSTLLKILSRITLPTSGSAIIRGRVGSLLEVGTGFHLELTGRENIFLYGAILGMKQSEVRKRFDEIVAFAENEKFLDTPMKHYSSGMYMRLAFAVASHLESEILLVDEVLAVGDMNFQNKSIKKMEEVTHQGRTVLLISHNMGVLTSLAQRSILINRGKLEYDGKTEQVIKKYLELSHTQESKQHPDLTIKKVVLKNNSNKVTSVFKIFDPLQVEIHYRTRQTIRNPFIWISITNRNGPLFSASTMLDGKSPASLAPNGIIRCSFDKLSLLPGVYGVEIGIKDKTNQEFYFHSPSFAHITVTEKNDKSTGVEGDQRYMWLSSDYAAPLLTPYQWQMETL